MVVKIDKKGVGRLLKSQEMLRLTESYAKRYPNTHPKPFIGFDRAKTIVYPNTKENPE